MITHEASGPTLMDKVIEFLAVERAIVRQSAEEQAKQPDAAAPPAAAGASCSLTPAQAAVTRSSRG